MYCIFNFVNQLKLKVYDMYDSMYGSMDPIDKFLYFPGGVPYWAAGVAGSVWCGSSRAKAEAESAGKHQLVVLSES